MRSFSLILLVIWSVCTTAFLLPSSVRQAPASQVTGGKARVVGLNSKVLPLYSTNFGMLGVDQALGEWADEDEIPWFEALQAYAETKPNDPFLKGIGSLTWTQFCTRCQNDWIADPVDMEEDRDRLSSLLEALLDAIKAYFYSQTMLEVIISPSTNAYDQLFTERERIEAFGSGQHVVIRERDRYFDANVDFWSELASVLKSQEDVPTGLPKLDQVSVLPAPYGQQESSIIMLNMPSLIPLQQMDDFGGVQDQIASLMIFKAKTLPALQALRRQPSQESLMEYGSMLGRVFRKAGRWFGSDPESSEFLESLYRETRGRLGTEDPTKTGNPTPGGFPCERRGPEDIWLEESK